MQHEIRSFLDGFRSQIHIEWGNDEFTQAASILSGVTKIEALNILATLVVKRSMTRADLTELSKAKDSIFSDPSGIERVTLCGGDYEVGGLAGLRQWLTKKRPLLTMDLRDRGMRPPRGCYWWVCQDAEKRCPPRPSRQVGAAASPTGHGIDLWSVRRAVGEPAQGGPRDG
ncbi:MAG: hypothetical protein LC749_07865 [Actinobacteria bacterium]|nr:hypothetical protein [Actinomycetota bacterium]